jgi:uncharacterized peroxidase-related enzyme
MPLRSNRFGFSIAAQVLEFVMSAWIRMITDEEASPELRATLDSVRAPSGDVGNVMRVHSLRPHTMVGHQTLYMAALHDDGNQLPMWFQEVIASWVSILNRCDYSLTNHFANARHLMGDDARADAVLEALRAHEPERVFDGAERAMLVYAGKLTLHPGDMVEADVKAMRDAGVDDGCILETNQICCYFNYANRLLNGLGVTLEGDVIGFYVEPETEET